MVWTVPAYCYSKSVCCTSAATALSEQEATAVLLALAAMAVLLGF
jgi:hypothetical protein